MKIVLVKNTTISLTEQLYSQIKSYALSRGGGEEKLPSIRSLAVELGVSVITVKNAYELLQNEGFISARQGSGVYLNALAPDLVSEVKTKITHKAKEILRECKNSGVKKEQLQKLIDELYD